MPIPVYNNAHTLSLSPHRAYRKGPKIHLCKSLKIKGHFSQKIQGTYFKISALYFKIYGLYFLQHALCFFASPNGFPNSRFARYFMPCLSYEFPFRCDVLCFPVRLHDDVSNDYASKASCAGFCKSFPQAASCKHPSARSRDRNADRR